MSKDEKVWESLYKRECKINEELARRLYNQKQRFHEHQQALLDAYTVEFYSRRFLSDRKSHVPTKIDDPLIECVAILGPGHERSEDNQPNFRLYCHASNGGELHAESLCSLVLHHKGTPVPVQEQAAVQALMTWSFTPTVIPLLDLPEGLKEEDTPPTPSYCSITPCISVARSTPEGRLWLLPSFACVVSKHPYFSALSWLVSSVALHWHSGSIRALMYNQWRTPIGASWHCGTAYHRHLSEALSDQGGSPVPSTPTPTKQDSGPSRLVDAAPSPATFEARVAKSEADSFMAAAQPVVESRITVLCPGDVQAMVSAVICNPVPEMGASIQLSLGESKAQSFYSFPVYRPGYWDPHRGLAVPTVAYYQIGELQRRLRGDRPSSSTFPLSDSSVAIQQPPDEAHFWEAMAHTRSWAFPTLLRRLSLDAILALTAAVISERSIIIVPSLEPHPLPNLAQQYSGAYRGAGTPGSTPPRPPSEKRKSKHKKTAEVLRPLLEDFVKAFPHISDDLVRDVTTIALATQTLCSPLRWCSMLIPLLSPYLRDGVLEVSKCPSFLSCQHGPKPPSFLPRPLCLSLQAA